MHNTGTQRVSSLTLFHAVWYHMNFIPKHNFNDPYPRSASIRGAYINSGSNDIGPDRNQDVRNLDLFSPAEPSERAD